MEKQLDIVPFKPNMAKAFKELNLDWLEAFFSVEPHDIELLDHCEESIINKGGFIFFCKNWRKCRRYLCSFKNRFRHLRIGQNGC